MRGQAVLPLHPGGSAGTRHRWRNPAEEGYGTEIRGLDDTVRSIVFSGSYNLPVIVEIVDTYEKLSRIFPFLEEHGDLHFLAVIEMKHALFTKYIQENAARMHRENEVHLLDKPEGA